MLSQILIPLDGSRRAEAILPVAILLAQATGRGLTLVRASTRDVGIPSMFGAPLAAAAIDQRLTAHRTGVTDYLTTTAHHVQRPGGPVQTAALAGEPGRAIRAYVAQHPEVQLIAMATHGHRGVSRWMLGSVAEEIVYQAPVPLLLLRPPKGPLLEGPALAFRTIVVPVDGSSFAEAALAQAQALAHATGARLVLVTAVEHLDAAVMPTGEISLWRRQHWQEIDHLARYQDRLAARLRSAGVYVGVQIGNGRPADVICGLSAAVHADLILLASHGRTGFQRLRLGSVALDVLEHATCPVFVLRPHPGQPTGEDAGVTATHARVAAGRTG